MNAALEALSQYRTITAQFPNEYLKQSRSYLWEQCLQDIITLEETPQHERQVLRFRIYMYSVTFCFLL